MKFTAHTNDLACFGSVLLYPLGERATFPGRDRAEQPPWQMSFLIWWAFWQCRNIGSMFGIRKRFQVVHIELRLAARTSKRGGEGMIILECLQNENAISLCTRWRTI